MLVNVKLPNEELVAAGTMAFHFSKPEGLAFRAGQFTDYTLISPLETDAEGSVRGFSLAQVPFEPNLVAATRIRHIAFKRVLKDFPIGTEVKLGARYGDFTMHKTECRPAAFINGGIAVTPVCSMIAQATHDKTSHKITMLYASRTPALLPVRRDFEQWSRDDANDTYIMTVDEPTAGCKGEHGLVTAEMVRKHVADLNKPIYYPSGPEGMLKAMRKWLLELKVSEDDVRTQEFTGY